MVTKLYVIMSIVMELIRYSAGSVMLSTLTMFARTLVVGSNYQFMLLGRTMDMEKIMRYFRIVVFVSNVTLGALWASFGLDISSDIYKLYRKSFYISLSGVALFVSLPVLSFYSSRLKPVTEAAATSKQMKKEIRGKIQTARYLFLMASVFYTYVGLSNGLGILAYEMTSPESDFNFYCKIIDSAIWAVLSVAFAIGYLWHLSYGRKSGRSVWMRSATRLVNGWKQSSKEILSGSGSAPKTPPSRPVTIPPAPAPAHSPHQDSTVDM
ncbi:hypothetical protein HDU91_005085 [Kappamyces sp. JEL0680]|nr:hypothetical protein HDU91_005085 [Kappamyces sp. JEL0680]